MSGTPLSQSLPPSSFETPHPFLVGPRSHIGSKTAFTTWLTSQACVQSNRTSHENISDVNRQCRTIIGDPPWPFKICWLCGFPVGEQHGRTMLESIATEMGLICYFVNDRSKRYDKQTCEHVFPVKLLGSALLMRSKYEEGSTLNTEEAIDLAHDFCNLLKKHGYTATLRKTQTGTQMVLSYEGLEVAAFQIDAWPDHLLDGAMMGPSLFSAIGISNGPHTIWFQSSIHVYLFFKLLDSTDRSQWPLLFQTYNSNIPKHDDYTQIFKDNMTKLKGRTPAQKDFMDSVRNIRNIGEAHDIITEWKEAIKRAMTARTTTLIDFLKKTDRHLGSIILPLLYTSSDPTIKIRYENDTDGIVTELYGQERDLTYEQLNNILQRRLENLDPSILNTERLRVGVRATKGKAKGVPIPLSQWPRSLSLTEYLDSPIFQLQVIEQLKEADLTLAISGVVSYEYNESFRKKLKSVINSPTNSSSSSSSSSNMLRRTPSATLLEIAKAKSTTCSIDSEQHAQAAASSTDHMQTTTSGNNSEVGEIVYLTNSGEILGNDPKRTNVSNLQPSTSASASALGTPYIPRTRLFEPSISQSQSLILTPQPPPLTRQASLRQASNNERKRFEPKRTGPPERERNGGSRKQRKLRKPRNHCTRKQKKNRKTRKNKKLTKRF